MKAVSVLRGNCHPSSVTNTLSRRNCRVVSFRKFLPASCYWQVAIGHCYCYKILGKNDQKWGLFIVVDIPVLLRFYCLVSALEQAAYESLAWRLGQLHRELSPLAFLRICDNHSAVFMHNSPDSVQPHTRTLAFPQFRIVEARELSE